MPLRSSSLALVILTLFIPLTACDTVVKSGQDSLQLERPAAEFRGNPNTEIRFTPTSGAPGRTVTLTGLEKFKVETIFFNEAEAADLTVDEEGIVEAVVPEAATTGLIKAVTHRGSLTSSEEFEVTSGDSEESNELSFEPESGPPGTVVSLTGLSALEVEAIFFNDSEAEDFTVVGDGVVEAIVPADATTGPIRAESNPGEIVSTEDFEVVEADDPLHTDPPLSECMVEPDAYAVTDFGPLTADATDSETIATNTATINTAIDEVGRTGGGIVCLPAGTFHVAPPDLYASDRNIVSIKIDHSNLTLWGAGRNDDGQGTALYSRGEYSVIDGDVVRGHGMRVVGGNENITLRDFELNGQAGWTGNNVWPADPQTGDGWDISHKGLILSWNDGTLDNVKVERVAVRAFKGEVLYQGGEGLERAVFDDIISEDTNAQAFNVHGRVIVENSFFGLSTQWMELDPHFSNKFGTFRNNTFEDCTRGVCITFGEGHMTEVPFLFEENHFKSCNVTSSSSGSAFMFGQGVAGPVEVRNNEFEDCALFEIGITGSGSDESPENILFENNTLHSLESSDGFKFTFAVNDITIRGNDFSWASPGDAWSYGWESYTGLIEGNSFENERYRPVVHGSGLDMTLLSRQNKFSSDRFRSNERNITADNPTPIILHEEAAIRPDTDGLEVFMPIGKNADGQKVLIYGHSSRAAVFRAGNTTYDVPQDIYVVGGKDGTVLTLQYDASREIWVQAP